MAPWISVLSSWQKYMMNRPERKLFMNMTSKERCKIAMSGGMPDKVPVIPQICHPHAIRTLGMNFRETMVEVVKNPYLINKIDLECARIYGVDGVRVWIPPEPVVHIIDDGEDVWQIDEKTGGKIGRIDFQGGGLIVPVEEKSILNKEEDIEKIPIRSAEELLKTEQFQSMRKIIKEAEKEMFIISAPGAFTVEYVAVNRGKQQMLIDLLERPEFVEKMIKKATDNAIQVGIALVKLGADALYIGDTFGGVIGPRLFEEFCSPAIKRFVKELKRFDVLIYFHVCGNSTPLFEIIADTGVDCIEPLDPLGGVSISEAKKRVGKRVALMGGVNTLKLAHGTLQEVIENCQRCLREGAPEGGYLLACGDMLPTETSQEKVKVMISAAHNYIY